MGSIVCVFGVFLDMFLFSFCFSTARGIVVWAQCFVVFFLFQCPPDASRHVITGSRPELSKAVLEITKTNHCVCVFFRHVMEVDLSFPAFPFRQLPLQFASFAKDTVAERCRGLRSATWIPTTCGTRPEEGVTTELPGREERQQKCGVLARLSPSLILSESQDCLS